MCVCVGLFSVFRFYRILSVSTHHTSIASEIALCITTNTWASLNGILILSLSTPNELILSTDLIILVICNQIATVNLVHFENTIDTNQHTQTDKRIEIL